MTLQEAIKEVKLTSLGLEFSPAEIYHGQFNMAESESIATILNAVVKGELK